jgi:NADP-dependent 3-hydroxy acid dehydrogenase YdfG
MPSNDSSPVAVISGASSGIGEATTRAGRATAAASPCSPRHPG